MHTPGDPKPQGAREPDSGPRVRETANEPGHWGGAGGGSLRVLAARGAARLRSSFQGEKMDFSANGVGIVTMLITF